MLTLAPFGFRPAYHPTGLDRASQYTIASGYATSIFKGDPVILNTNGTITIGTAAADLLGVFNGVEYVDANGKPTVSNFWPASTTLFTGSEMKAWVWDHPDMIFDIQSNGSVAQTALGDQADVVMGTGSTSTGLSNTVLSSSLAGAGAQAQCRIVGFNLDPANAVGDAFTIVQVKIARHQYVSNKVAI